LLWRWPAAAVLIVRIQLGVTLGAIARTSTSAVRAAPIVLLI